MAGPGPGALTIAALKRQDPLWNDMNVRDLLATQERITVNRRTRADGIVDVAEHISLPVEFRIRRFQSDAESDLIEKAFGAESAEMAAWKESRVPYLETRDGGILQCALLTNGGGLRLWTALRDGISGTSLIDNTNAKLIVSNVTGSPNATDTALANEIGRKGMDTSFPLIPGGTAGGRTAAVREFVLRGTFGASDAVGDWRRFWIVGASDFLIDNFSSSQGTKGATGQIWELTCGITVT